MRSRNRRLTAPSDLRVTQEVHQSRLKNSSRSGPFNRQNGARHDLTARVRVDDHRVAVAWGPTGLVAGSGDPMKGATQSGVREQGPAGLPVP